MSNRTAHRAVAPALFGEAVRAKQLDDLARALAELGLVFGFADRTDGDVDLAAATDIPLSGPFDRRRQLELKLNRLLGGELAPAKQQPRTADTDADLLLLDGQHASDV